ncbi:peptide chain release factor N(5)-glutamine methyltransferase [Bifidobacterium pseudolongum]|uniref:peptide chain release factor N(5)-glutamine methyltransferase n=1 Tax=Bifidobacterium pseudolongum TaxID=1694 RepID=UPI0010EAFC6B|nr:SAM-dependent methyltransferase [Bifidobacterium pseudolongum subsp. globosum]RYQ06819.1 SAM-dependent methyltransferase [Bifidobacterium pseudolongum subsp. globosum]RYQ07870.1 SAM-dependent methyltransferase [Bifidobacterium pseudolongum subsp. globosum]RYQ13613.1 SAM-dependent methyltransferase [Bifidobacterium pseudolongum subsp. globosum]
MNEQTRPIESDAPRMGAVLEAAAARLARAGIDTARHDAKLLLAESAGRSLSDVDKAVLMDDAFSQFAPSPEARGAFESMLGRRESREPLQHIVGHAPFRYLDLDVGPGVFVPRPETELVVQEAIDWITAHGLYSPRVVDLCAGSGAIGLAIATEVPGAQVWAVELDTQAAQWTRRNMHKVGERFPDLVANYRLEVADATCPVTLATLDGTADVVISNPPYIPLTNVPQQPEVRDFDPDTALYGGSADGMMIPERIIVRAAALVRKGGLFVMEHDITQGDRTVAFARANGFTEARTHTDLTGRPRYLVATR